MKTIKTTSKKGRQMKANYLNAQYSELYQVYEKYSTNKQVALLECKQLCIKENGERFRIIAWNTFQFTCGWTTEKGIRIETAQNSYIIIKN